MNETPAGRDPRRFARAALWLGVVGLAALVWFQFSRSVRVIPADEAAQSDALLLQTLDMQPWNLDDQRGRVVLLNLWAAWCAPCRTEIPALNRIASEFADRGLVVIGVNVEQIPPAQIDARGRELGIEYPIALPTDTMDGTFRGAGVIPHSWLIDRQGRVRVSHAGVLTERSLRNACRRLLDEDG